MDQKEMKKKFYKLPMLVIPSIAVIVLINVLYQLFRLRVKGWVYIVVISLIVVITIGAEFVAFMVSKAMVKDDEITEKKMAFNKFLSGELQNLEARTPVGPAREAVHKLWEDARYSDPMSSGATAETECKIGEMVVTLTEAITEKDEAKILDIVDEMKLLIAERNRVCKAAK